MTKIKNPYSIKREFRNTLDDIGATLTHPNVSQVRLLDIYTFPRIELINYGDDEKDTAQHNDDSEAIINNFQSNIRVSFIGPENIGKSALLKIIFLKLHAKGLVPVIIEGRRINQTSIDDFKKVALESFNKQYNSTNDEQFYQLSKSKVVILIDDFDRIIINKKYKGKLLSNLLKHYENIIITGDQLMSLEEFLSEDQSDNTLISAFKTYRVKEFGHLLRGRFINKWITLGNQERISETDRIRRLDEAENIIRTVTGKNLVPNYPIFLLTILQAIEIGNPSDLTASTFGHYYQFLIQKSFGNIFKTQHEITSYNNYIIELAYYFFKNNIKLISLNDLKKFDTEYRSDFTITPNIDQIIENLCLAKVIEEYDKNYEFKYLYIYYFFVSKYLAENINRSDIQRTISALIERVYQTEFANILLFLTHHTKHEYLLNEVLKTSKTIFTELSMFKLDSSSKSLNKLASSLPKRTYNVKTVDEHREEVNIKKDEIDERDDNKASTQIADIAEDTSKLGLISRLNLAFKMLDILGQILKNNYGKISNSELYDLVEETYLLGLRTLNLFFQAIEGNIDNLIVQIKAMVEEKNIKGDRKIEAASKQILFSICSDITYEFIKKISDSLGTQDLEKIYSSVLSKNQFNSVKLIDFSIRLDHFKSFPNSEMGKLKVDFFKNPLALDIMRKMVINYLYLFPTIPSQKQKILSFLDISMDAQRKIDFTSKVKKQ